MADFPLYVWSPSASRYRSKRSGRFVPPDAVRRALDVALQQQAAKARDLAGQLRAGLIDVDTWSLGMRDVVRNTQLFAAAAGRGGFAQMDGHAFGLIGQRTQVQYGFLTKFAAEIDAGLPLDGRFLARAELYAKAAKPAFVAARQDVVRQSGFDEERSILHPAEHCTVCIAEDAKGFQPVGQMVPIGSRTCLANDRCSVEFRNSATGEVVAA